MNLTPLEWGRFVRLANATVNLAAGGGLLLLGQMVLGLAFSSLGAVLMVGYLRRWAYRPLDTVLLGIALLLNLYVFSVVLELLWGALRSSA